MKKMPWALRFAQAGSRIEARGSRISFLGPRTCPRSRGRFHDSFNLDAELKETLNESSGLRVPFASSSSDKYFDFNLLRENDLESTPWHMGCKPFRRFE
jgi:hypothetical protein